MASRSEKLQREYLEKHGDAKAVKKTEPKVKQKILGEPGIFWIYKRKNRLYPVPYKITLPWEEINQLKHPGNTYQAAI